MPEIVPCNLCSSERLQDEVEKAEFLNMAPSLGVARCKECNFLFQSPRPTRGDLKQMYETHPYYSADNATRGESRQDFYNARFARVEEISGPPGKMLGLGCLEGGYALQVAASRGWQVNGVEFSEILADHARQQLDLDVVVADAWDLSALSPGNYDLIYSHSLEHVPDARHSVAGCHSLLKPGGFLVLEVPNQFYSLKDILKRVFMSLLPGRKHLFYQEVKAEFHTYFFNPQTIRRLLTSEGFEILSLRTYIPGHPVYLSNPRWRWLQEAIYAAGGVVGRGPCIEIIATRKPA